MRSYVSFIWVYNTDEIERGGATLKCQSFHLKMDDQLSIEDQITVKINHKHAAIEASIFKSIR